MRHNVRGMDSLQGLYYDKYGISYQTICTRRAIRSLSFADLFTPNVTLANFSRQMHVGKFLTVSLPMSDV